MIEELYINGTLADIEMVDIVRNYTSPFFSDVTQLYNDGTQTVRLPLTATNAAIFEHCYREDFVSDIPYEIQRADYYYDGLLIFKDAEVKILSVEPDYIEVQFVYGVDRTTISPLFDKKLNEITEAEIQEEYANWLFEWRKSIVVYDATPTVAYNFLDYVSGIRTSDVETISGTVQPKLQPEEPALSNLKQMTTHPFILADNIIDLIDVFSQAGISTLFGTRLNDKGLILSGNKDDYDYEYSYTYDSSSETSQELHISTAGGNDEIITFDRYRFQLLDFLLIDDYSVKLVLDLQILTEYELQLWKTNLTDSTSEKVSDIPYATKGDFDITYDCTIELTMQQGFEYYLKFDHSVPVGNDADGTFKIQKNITEAIYSMTDSVGFGRYDCIKNLPEITCIEFIKQMLIHTGLFVGYGTAGTLKTLSLDTFATNIAAGTCYDWSGRISNVRKGRFQFNSNGQKNYIKFANDKDLTADRKETLIVDDLTIESEKDLYNFEFDSPLGAYDEKSEMIMYEQTVKRSGDTGVSFENKYVGDKWNNGFVKNVSGVAKNLKVADPTYYAVYKKLIERPTIKEVDVNLGLYESATIDFEKPIYISEFGRYCLLLELQAPNNDVCVAKLLIVNQKLT